MILNNLANVPPLRRVLVDVPELGDGAQILLQEFSAIKSSEFNEEFIKSGEVKGPKRLILFYARLICASAIDENGNHISDPSQAESLATTWKDSLIFKVGEKAAELNGFSKRTEEESEKEKKPGEQNQQKS